MANPLKKESKLAEDKSTHKGYNEKNPTQPQGAFKADSMETNSKTARKSNGKKIKT